MRSETFLTAEVNGWLDDPETADDDSYRQRNEDAHHIGDGACQFGFYAAHIAL